MTNYELIVSILQNLGRGAISIAFFIAFIFMIGMIWTMVQEKSFKVFDDIDEIWANGALAFFISVGVIAVGVAIWGIGFIINGGVIAF